MEVFREIFCPPKIVSPRASLNFHPSAFTSKLVTRFCDLGRYGGCRDYSVEVVSTGQPVDGKKFSACTVIGFGDYITHSTNFFL